MITYNNKEGLYILRTKQVLPISLMKSWGFFSNPENLYKITPSYMNFNMLSDFKNMHEGQIIKYKVSPFPLFRVGWKTKIIFVNKPFRFIDKQISGPFSLWEHEHIFKEKNNQLHIHDIVKYKLPLGIIGRLFGGLIVKKQLETIFEYRRVQLNKIFNKS